MGHIEILFGDMKILLKTSRFHFKIWRFLLKKQRFQWRYEDKQLYEEKLMEITWRDNIDLFIKKFEIFS